MKMIIFHLMTSGAKVVDLRSNPIEKKLLGHEESYQMFFILPSYRTFGANTDYLQKEIAVFSKFGLW